MVDGDSRLGAFFHITLPLLKPAIAAATILRFMFNWNEFLFASTLTATKAKTMPVAIAQFGAWLMIDWGTMSALGIIAIAPIILLSLFVQKYIISGLTLGAVRE
jgi:multiple sugar transport system permease protein